MCVWIPGSVLRQVDDGGGPLLTSVELLKNHTEMRVGIVGAGVSGLVCAQRLLSLASPGLQLTVFEWGRGPGGRTARRRVTLDSGAELSFDHAAPFITATPGSELEQLLNESAEKGRAQRWAAAGENVWVGTPSNHAICKALAEELETAGAARMLYGRHVRSAAHDPSTREWTLRATNRATERDEEHTFDALVLSDKLLVLPNPYAVIAPAEWGALALPETLASTGAVVLMLALEHPSPSAGAALPALLSAQRHALPPPLELVVHESAKPGRAAGGVDLWVAHSTREYAAARLRDDDGSGPSLDDHAAVLAEMRAAALAALSAVSRARLCASSAPSDAEAPFAPTVVHASVFAWDHAQTARGSRVTGATHSLDTARRAGVCGDFFAGPAGFDGVEAAAVSGASLANAMVPLLRAREEST